MSRLAVAILALCTALAAAAGPARAAGPPRKKVLVELYTSQGCNSCPPASDLLGRLADLGYGPDRFVLVNFHVDYFNDPWADPYSDAAYGRRQLEYNEVQKRNDLYFTPLMMVDGREPLLGSDQPKARAALDRALREPPAVALGLAVVGAGAARSAEVVVSARSPLAAGRDLLVGLALTEDPVATRVPSGENAGKRLVEHAVARSFARKVIRLDRSGATTLTFPLTPGAGQVAARSRVAAFVQDRATGEVHQAESVPFEPGPDRAGRRSGPPRRG